MIRAPNATTPDYRDYLDVFACPVCRESLEWAPESARCGACGTSFPIVDGIPVLLGSPVGSEHDELDHAHHVQRTRQARFFDEAAAAEFEIRRPHGTPLLYQHLLRQKFMRATRDLGRDLRGWSALTVCGGSGMDAEFLARAGAEVISSDISLGAARRARERARRFKLRITPIVADVDALPFRDRSMDLVLVHDGLHHLERPLDALKEMGRVAGKAVSVTEPSAAIATRAAVRLGLALDREEAGNRVARLELAAVSARLRAGGLQLVRAERYAMYYPHEPGLGFRLLSTRGVLHLVETAWRIGNAIAGRAGNKLVVVASRP
jgi:SAM-dependent methyltransferase